MKNSAASSNRSHPSTSRRCAAQFPVLARLVHGKPLAYLDNGASAQRPNAVIDAVDDYERHHHANIHRGVHTLSQEATALYEGARDRADALHQCALAQRNHLRARHDRSDQSGGAKLCAAAPASRAMRCSSRISSTTPTSCPGRWSASRPARKLVVAPIDARGEVHVEAVEALMSPRTKTVRLRACLECARARCLPVRRLIAARQGSRHHHADRRRAGGPAHDGRRAGTGLRFLCLLRPQDVRSDRHRRALRPRGSCSSACRRGRAAAT